MGELDIKKKLAETLSIPEEMLIGRGETAIVSSINGMVGDVVLAADDLSFSGSGVVSGTGTGVAPLTWAPSPRVTLADDISSLHAQIEELRERLEILERGDEFGEATWGMRGR